MATKNIVPRANGEGGIGTSAKRWLNGFFKNITVETAANVPTAGDSENSTKAASTAWVENVFFAKLVTKLAASTAASISSLNTSSLFYRMLSWALTASGVQYNFTNSSAWYICFGSLLGGLIIQGGQTYSATAVHDATLSITPPNGRIRAAVLNDIYGYVFDDPLPAAPKSYYGWYYQNGTLRFLVGERLDTSHWFVICD